MVHHRNTARESRGRLVPLALLIFGEHIPRTNLRAQARTLPSDWCYFLWSQATSLLDDRSEGPHQTLLPPHPLCGRSHGRSIERVGGHYLRGCDFYTGFDRSIQTHGFSISQCWRITIDCGNHSGGELPVKRVGGLIENNAK